MTVGIIEAVTALAERLATVAVQDDGLRDGLRRLARAVLAATERQPEPTPAGPAPQAGDQDGPYEPETDLHAIIEAEAEAAPAPTPAPAPPPTPEPSPAVAMPEAAPPPSPLPELTLGKPIPPPPGPRMEPAPAPTREFTTDAALPVIEAHCRLKAEGIRWAATRRRRLDEGAEFRVEIAPRDREILDRGRDLGCFLWMNVPDFIVPEEPAALEDASGCFEAVADAVALVREMLPDMDANRAYFEPALDLLAEAQSALRVAIDRIDGPHDPDQFGAYDWLRGVAAREQIYIRRYMRLDDPADPAALPAIERRREALDASFQGVRQRAKRRKSQFGRLRYHAQLIGKGNGTEYDWQKMAGAIGEMVEDGVPPSSLEIREILLPILDLMPDIEEPPTGFGLVLREIDRYLAGRMVMSDAATPEAPTAQVAEVARLLAGKGAVLIGGVRRPEAYEALKAAFGLKDLVWFETREHESIDTFQPYVARPDVALVLLAIRWSSHSFGEVKRFCDDHGKPMVRLPGGYNPNQVAAQILAQCSGQLEGGRLP